MQGGNQIWFNYAYFLRNTRIPSSWGTIQSMGAPPALACHFVMILCLMTQSDVLNKWTTGKGSETAKCPSAYFITFETWNLLTCYVAYIAMPKNLNFNNSNPHLLTHVGIGRCGLRSQCGLVGLRCCYVRDDVWKTTFLQPRSWCPLWTYPHGRSKISYATVIRRKRSALTTTAKRPRDKVSAQLSASLAQPAD